MARLNRCHGLYYAAMRADAKFERTIKKIGGKSATRWTLTPAQRALPVVRKALARKVAVDNARWRACDVMRKGGFRDAVPGAPAATAPAAPAQPKPLGRARRRRRR